MLLSIQGKIYTIEEIQDKVISLINQIESAYQKRLINLKRYFKELNGETTIPDPQFEWQSRFVSSLFYQKIFFAYALLRKFLDKAFENLFEVETENPVLQSAIKRVLEHYIKILDLKTVLSQTLYYSLLSAYGLIYFDYDTNLRRITIQTFNPLLTKITPDKNYVCITKYLPAPEVIRRYKVELTADDFYSLTTEEEETYTYLKNIYNNALVRIDEIYGILVVNPDDVILPTKYIVLNKQKVIEAESFYDHEKPFVVEFLYGIDAQISFADLVYPYHVQDTIITRAFLDTALLTLSIGIEMDVTSLDPDASPENLQPFMVLRKKTPEDVIKNFSLANFNPNVLPIRQLILQEATNISAITEFLMGLPTSKGRPTAKEVMLKTQQSIQTLSVFVEKFETSFLKQVLQKLLYFIIKYEANNLAKGILANYPEEFIALSEIKPEEIYRQVDFKITAFSQIVDKQAKLEKFLATLGVLSDLGLAQAINPIALIRELMSLLDLPKDLLNPQALLSSTTPQSEEEQEKQEE